MVETFAVWNHWFLNVFQRHCTVSPSHVFLPPSVEFYQNFILFLPPRQKPQATIPGMAFQPNHSPVSPTVYIPAKLTCHLKHKTFLPFNIFPCFYSSQFHPVSNLKNCLTFFLQWPCSFTIFKSLKHYFHLYYLFPCPGTSTLHLIKCMLLLSIHPA